MGIELELPCRNEKGTFLVQVSRQDGQKTELQEIITSPAVKCQEPTGKKFLRKGLF